MPTEHRNARTTSSNTYRPSSSRKNWRDQVIAKAYAGNLSNAFKFLIPNGLADTSDPETSTKLQALHPANDDMPSIDDEATLQPDLLPPTAPFSLNPKQLEQLIKSFPRGTAPGPDGLRAQHLRDILRVPSGDVQSNPRAAIIRLVTFLAEGKANESVARHLAGARLIPLEKKDGGVRPIAIGCVWRRLVAKSLILASTDKLGPFFAPFQLGVRVRNGSEVIVKAVQHICANRTDDHDFVVFQADFSNAFNNISRPVFRAEIVRNFPEMAPWVNWCYEHPTELIVSNREHHEIIESLNGAQQGDPLGPLLFSIALQRIVTGIQEDLKTEGIDLAMNCWFLDDGTIAGTPTAVAAAIELLSNRGPTIGLKLNFRKCSLFWPSGSNHNSSLLPEDIPITNEGFKCLGIPIGTQEYIAGTLRSRMNNNIAYLDRLRDLENPQVGTELLTMCGGFCRFNYETRALHPSITQEFCQEFDDHVMETFQRLNGLPELATQARTQTTLPIKSGGFGLRSTFIHSMAAFTASHNTTTLCIKDWKILQDNRDIESLPARGITEEEWFNRTGIPATDNILDNQNQSEISEIIDNHATSQLLAKADTPDRARLLACQGSSPGAVIHVPLAPARGFHLAPHEYQIFAKYRLGLPNLCLEDETCSLCKKPMDAEGYHMVNCKFAGSVTRRHDALRDVVFNFCQRASWNPQREIACLQAAGPQFESLIPADIFIPGIPAALDVTVVHPLQNATLRLAAANRDAASTFATKRKFDKYHKACVDSGVELHVLAMEFYGRWSKPSTEYFQNICSAIATRVSAKPGRFFKELERKLAVAHWRMTARAVMIRHVDAQDAQDLGQQQQQQQQQQ